MNSVRRVATVFAMATAILVIVVCAVISCNMSPTPCTCANCTTHPTTSNTNNSSVSAVGIVPTEVVNGVVVAAVKKGPNRIDYSRGGFFGEIYEDIFVVETSMSDDYVYYHYVNGKLASVRFKVNGVRQRIDDPTQLAKYEPKAKTVREQVIKEFSTVMPPR